MPCAEPAALRPAFRVLRLQALLSKIAQALKGARPQERQEYGQSIEGRNGKCAVSDISVFDRIGLRPTAKNHAAFIEKGEII